MLREISNISECNFSDTEIYPNTFQLIEYFNKVRDLDVFDLDVFDNHQHGWRPWG